MPMPKTLTVTIEVGSLTFVIDMSSLEKLRSILGRENVRSAREDLITYSFDATATPKKLPMCIAFPEKTTEISEVLRFASECRIPVVTRGSGSGLSGGSIPAPGCIVLCLSRLDRILELDQANLTILAEAGAITQSIAERAERAGLFYPPDPGSMKISTIGGNVAENAGGLHGLKYGVTRDYVMGLEVVLATGEVVWTGNKCMKDVAGYSIRDLFVGSEGTLGVITKVLLKLLPKTRMRRTLMIIYERMEDAAATVTSIIASKILPCTLEFLDKTTIHCVEEFARLALPLDAEAILLVESDGHPAVVDEEVRAMEEIARSHNARSVRTATTPEEARLLMAARRAAFPALARVAPTTILEDATVPRSELVRMVRHIQDVANRYKLRIGTFGHMGDGNLHPTFLTNERDHEEMARVETAMGEIFEYAIALGGTITGEHGVGLAKKKYLPRQIGPIGMRIMQEFRRAVDPAGILNPGKIFD